MPDVSSSPCRGRPTSPTESFGPCTGPRDFLSPDFIALNKRCHAGLQKILKTETATITAYAATGHGSKRR